MYPFESFKMLAPDAFISIFWLENGSARTTWENP
jgi:hypothetical protein